MASRKDIGAARAAKRAAIARMLEAGEMTHAEIGAAVGLSGRTVKVLAAELRRAARGTP